MRVRFPSGAFRRAVLPDKVLQACQDGSDCVCAPRQVPEDDPSWSEWTEVRLKEEKKFRIDDAGVCLPGAI